MGFVHPKHDGLLSQSKLKKDEKGNLLADTKNYLTSERSIYAAGDARRAVISSMGYKRRKRSSFSYS